jgi:hypothetical protein
MEATGAQGKADASDFDRDFPKVAQWRWGTTLKVLSWLLPLWSKLEKYWDAGVYEAALTKHEVPGAAMRPGGPHRNRLDTGLVTEAINSNLFWHYCDLCVSIQTLLDTLGSWAESCPCHGRSIYDLSFRVAPRPNNPVISPATRWFRQLVGQDAKLMFDQCPFSGKRAPEFACGADDVVFQALANSASSQDLAAPSWAALSPDETAIARTIGRTLVHTLRTAFALSSHSGACFLGSSAGWLMRTATLHSHVPASVLPFSTKLPT